MGKEINIYWTLQRIIRFSPQSPSQVTIVLIPIAQMRKLRCRVKLQAQDHMIGKCQKPGPCHTYSVDSTRGWGGAPFYLNSPHLHHEDSSEFSVSLRRCPNSYPFLFLSQGLSHLIIRHCILTPTTTTMKLPNESSRPPSSHHFLLFSCLRPVLWGTYSVPRERPRAGSSL